MGLSWYVSSSTWEQMVWGEIIGVLELVQHIYPPTGEREQNIDAWWMNQDIALGYNSWFLSWAGSSTHRIWSQAGLPYVEAAYPALTAI